MINALIATQFVLHYTIMATSFAYLKPFLSTFDSNFGATIKLDASTVSSYHQGSKNQGNSYLMKPMSRSDAANESTTRRATDADETRRDRNSSQDSNAPIIVKIQNFQMHTELTSH